MKVKDIVSYFQSCNPEYPEYKFIFTPMSPEGDVYKSRKIVEKFRYPERYVLVEFPEEPHNVGMIKNDI
jgi:hypothetical protein